MGLLDLFSGMGKADAAPWYQRLSSGLGQQGGLLSKMGMGQFGNGAPGDPSGMGGMQQSGLADFIQQLTQPQGSPPEGGGGQQPQLTARQPGSPPTGLSEAIMAYLKQTRR